MTFARRSSVGATNVVSIATASPSRVMVRDEDAREEHRQFVQLRAALGVTQLELAALLKRGRATVERYESGRVVIPGRVLIRMRRLLNERNARRAA